MARYTAGSLLRLRPAVPDGYDLRGRPLDERSELLEEIVTPDGVLARLGAFPGRGRAMLEAARETGWRACSPNAPSAAMNRAAASDWLKIKIVTRAGVRHRRIHRPQGERYHFGALVLGVYEKAS